MLPKQTILGVDITRASEKEILEYIITSIKAKKKLHIVTPNPEMIVYAKNNEYFKNILNNAAISLPDGVGLIWAAKILNYQLQERITGVDFMELLCRESVGKNISIGLLGGRNRTAEKTVDVLEKKYPGIKIAFVKEDPEGLDDGRVFNQSSNKNPSSAIDFLFVAFGHPKQEEWIAENLKTIPVYMAMGVGGAFDYLSGSVPRAPFWMRRIGLEWLFRLLVQPWRWKRQVALIHFLGLVVKEKFL